LVAVPKIAQQKLDDAELILDSLVVTNTQGQNLTMTLSSTIKTDGSVHADIDSFEGVLYLEDHEPHTPFAKIRFPQTTADALQTVKVTQFLPIHDVEALTIFNTWLLANQTLRVTVLGDTHVRVRGIARSYPVIFKKTISTPGTQHLSMGVWWLSRVLIYTCPGLRLLEGTVVNPTWIGTEPDDNDNNMRATTIIPNHSVVSFELVSPFKQIFIPFPVSY
jgi:hypothetical protein